MKAVRAHEIGGPETLRVEEIPDPTPGPGEIVVRLEEIGVNFIVVAAAAAAAARRRERSAVA